MKIYVDDVRSRPEGFTVLVHSVNEAIRIIEYCEKKGEPIELISPDHDLSEFAPDGGDGYSNIFIKALSSEDAS